MKKIAEIRKSKWSKFSIFVFSMLFLCFNGNTEKTEVEANGVTCCPEVGSKCWFTNPNWPPLNNYYHHHGPCGKA